MKGEARNMDISCACFSWCLNSENFLMRSNICGDDDNGAQAMRIFAGRKPIASWKPHPAILLTVTELRWKAVAKLEGFKSGCAIHFLNRGEWAFVFFTVELSSQGGEGSSAFSGSSSNFLSVRWYHFHKHGLTFVWLKKKGLFCLPVMINKPADILSLNELCTYRIFDEQSMEVERKRNGWFLSFFSYPEWSSLDSYIVCIWVTHWGLKEFRARRCRSEVRAEVVKVELVNLFGLILSSLSCGIRC